MNRRNVLRSLLAAPVAAAANLEAKPELPKAPSPVFQPHTVFRVKSSTTGKPQMLMLKSWDDQIAFAKAEGLVPANAWVTISKDGEMVLKATPQAGPCIFPHTKTDAI